MTLTIFTMKQYKIFIIYVLVLFTANTGLGSGKKDLTKSLNDNVAVSNQNSHEEYHSKNSSDLSHQKSMDINVTNIKQSVVLNMSKTNSNQSTSVITSKPEIKNMSSSSTKQGMMILSEGGDEVKSSFSIKSNETGKQSTTVAIKVSPKPSVPAKSELGLKQLTPGTVDQKPVHKRIHGRPGVSESDVLSISSSTNNNNTTTKSPPVHKKKKPFFTMMDDKETKESESFIESSTTGRDYVLPIVLIILSLPIVGYLIKIIYRRGTEFTERQQYHRMYLIDGMYNSR